MRIVAEGTTQKFVDAVEQITFSGLRAVAIRQPVLYVTERCVFALPPEGLELVEVAPGIDIERDIVSHMAFRPLMRYRLACRMSSRATPRDRQCGWHFSKKRACPRVLVRRRGQVAGDLGVRVEPSGFMNRMPSAAASRPRPKSVAA